MKYFCGFCLAGKETKLSAVIACRVFRLLLHEYMIAVVQLDVFPTVILTLRNKGEKLDLSSFCFVLFYSLVLELGMKILSRAWIDELSVLRSDS